jgi:hypothetical protein
MVRQQKGTAGTRKGKHVWAGKKIPAIVVGFCGVCDIPIREENEDLLILLEIPEVFEYVLKGVFDVLALRHSNRR